MEKPAHLKIILYYLCLLELILLAVLLGARSRNRLDIAFAAEDLHGNYADGFENPDHWIMTPSLTARTGVYRVTVDYTLATPDREKYSAISHLTDSPYVHTLLPGENQQLTYTILVKDSDTPFAIANRLWYDVQGLDRLTIHSINIATSGTDLLHYALKFLCFFAVVNAAAYLYLFRNSLPKITKQSYHVVIGLLAATFVLSLPALISYFLYQHDILFHLSRIEGLKTGLLGGAFPVRIHPPQLSDHGYAASIYYGELFLYLPAFLRLAELPLWFCYSFYVVSVNFATLYIGYLCFKKMTGDAYIGLGVSFVYAANIYRLTNLFVRAAVGEYTAMTFFPLILYGLWAAYTPPPQEDAGNTSQSDKRLWLPLAIGYTGVIQSHIPSTALVGIVTVVVCLIMWKQTFKKETFFLLLKTLVVTILINLWFLLPLFDYLRYDWKVNSGVFNRNKEGMFEWFMDNAVYLPQFFMLDYTTGAPGQRLRYGIGSEMPFALGLTTLLALIFCLLFAVQGTATKQDKRREAFCFASIIGLIFAASTLCPWDEIAAVAPWIGVLENILQFPWRLNMLTALFAAWLLCLLAVKPAEVWQKYVFIAGFALIGLWQALDFNSKVLIQIPSVFGSEIIVNIQDIAEGEFLPAGANTADYVNSLTLGETSEIHYSLREYNRITVSATNYSNQSDFIEVPLINYPGYRAIDLNTGARLGVSDGASKRVKVEIPGDYSGVFTVRFVPPWYWRLAEAVSVATVVVLVWLAFGRGLVNKHFSGYNKQREDEPHDL